jgi:GMP synthase (glutamine-hydrolysing)
MTRELIAVVDLGSQYAQLIARRVRECRVYGELVPHTTRWEDLAGRNVKGVILSGGPASVYERGAPSVDPRLIDGRVPVLGICYGMQLMAHELGGEVVAEGKREYGPATVEISESVPIFAGLRPRERVWMSHGDSVRRPPKGFHVAGRSETAPIAALTDGESRFAVQFHPEVQHTPAGMDILRNFVLGVCGCRGDWTPASFVEEAVSDLQGRLGERRALCALSGGVDSAVAAALVARAIGERLVCVFVDTGLLREHEPEHVVTTFRDRVTLVAVDAERRFLDRLAGVVEPEQKRAIIGEEFVRVFETETERHGPIDVLVQGTIYPDVIESKAASDAAARIKTHHNVGGLPADMRLEVVEPLRKLFKDEVRRVGVELGLPEDILWRHPFPGPGLAVRIIGEVTKERLDTLRRADAIFLEELREAGLYNAVAQAFAVLTPVKSVGVMGDFRTYGDVIALRAVTTDDYMTADWARLPTELLARVSSRIVNEVPAVNRVVYDITSKPPGTIEWE